MERQHIENLFRRLKGEVIHIKCISGSTYEGKIVEVTNDYICVSETTDSLQQVYLLFNSIESMSVRESTN